MLASREGREKRRMSGRLSFRYEFAGNDRLGPALAWTKGAERR
jgi:hypothetical protein